MRSAQIELVGVIPHALLSIPERCPCCRALKQDHGDRIIYDCGATFRIKRPEFEVNWVEDIKGDWRAVTPEHLTRLRDCPAVSRNPDLALAALLRRVREDVPRGVADALAALAGVPDCGSPLGALRVNRPRRGHLPRVCPSCRGKRHADGGWYGEYACGARWRLDYEYASPEAELGCARAPVPILLRGVAAVFSASPARCEAWPPIADLLAERLL